MYTSIWECWLFLFAYLNFYLSDGSLKLSEMKDEKVHHVLILCGSLRKSSTNNGLLRAIVELKHPKFKFEWADISQFPVFNEDVEAQKVPAAVEKVRAQAAKCDAILYGIPEYNYSMASPFKNAYDWLSREYPNSKSPVEEKLGAIVSVGGGKGGLNAQRHFRESAEFRKVRLMPGAKNTIAVLRWGQKGQKFDTNGNLTDEETRKSLTPFLNEFDEWIRHPAPVSAKKEEVGCHCSLF